MRRCICISGLALFLSISGGCKQEEDASEAPREGITGEDVQREASEAVDAARGFAAQQKEKFVERMRQDLDDLEDRIEELRRQAEDAKGEVSVEVKIKIDELEEKRRAAREKLDKLKESGASAWEDLKAGVSRAVDDLADACDRAAERFDEAEHEEHAEQPEGTAAP